MKELPEKVKTASLGGRSRDNIFPFFCVLVLLYCLCNKYSTNGNL